MPEAIAHGVRLHYQRLGTPGAETRVAFVHGLVVDNLASWYFSIACSCAAFGDILLYDLRGHGLSERPPVGYRVEDMVLDLDELLAGTLGRAPVHLVGNSFGALLCVEYARRFPQRVAGLILVDGHLGNDGFAERMKRTLSLRGEEADRAIADTFRHWPGRESSRKRARLVAQARSLVQETSLVEDLRTTPPLAAQDFAAIRTPTLAVYGERSDLVQESATLLAAMPTCSLDVLPGCTHSVLWEATDGVRDRAIAFLRRVEGGSI